MEILGKVVVIAPVSVKGMALDGLRPWRLASGRPGIAFTLTLKTASPLLAVPHGFMRWITRES
jgi:hypothetical protein